MNWTIILVLSAGLFVSAVAGAKCTTQQINNGIQALKSSSPEGYRVYQAAPKSFLDPSWWTECQDGGFDSTVVAVHETVHHLSHDSYETISGKKLAYGNDQGLPQPSIIRSQISDDDRFKDLYLTPEADFQSSATNFSVLLDEFNAYTFGLHVANQLKSRDTLFQWRAGALTLLNYVSLYARQLQTSNPSAFARLKADPTLSSLKHLMDQAMTVIKRSCTNGTPVSNEDRVVIDQLCSSQGLAALTALTRTPYSCFKDCGKTIQNQSDLGSAVSPQLETTSNVLKTFGKGNEVFLRFGRP